MGDFVDRNQVRIFLILALLVMGACIVAVIFWGAEPIKWELIQGISESVVITACGCASGVVVGLVLLSHDYKWWGNAQGSVVYIGMGAILSVVAAVFGLANILKPLF